MRRSTQVLLVLMGGGVVGAAAIPLLRAPDCDPGVQVDLRWPDRGSLSRSSTSSHSSSGSSGGHSTGAVAATALGGAVLGFCLPLGMAIARSHSLSDMVLWAAIALVVQLASYVVVRFLRRHEHGGLESGRYGGGDPVGGGVGRPWDTQRRVPDLTGLLLALLLALLLVAAPAAAQTPVLGSPQTPASGSAPTAVATPHMVALMGRRLFGPGGVELGRLVDLVVDAEGRPLAVVADVGGFMGLGIRRVALAWGLLRFRVEPDMVRVSVEITPDTVTAAPEYRPGDPATILSLPARP